MEDKIQKLQENLIKLNSNSVLENLRNPKEPTLNIMWMDVTTLPTEEGKYIVETKTSMGNIHRLETLFDGEKFLCKNQKVIRWIKEY